MAQERVWQELVEQATLKAQNASDALARQRGLLDSAEQQHHQLASFRQDYAVQASAPGTTLSLSRMMHLRSFVENLDVALGQLEHQIMSLREAVSRAQQVLSDRRARQLALEKLVERRNHRQALLADRREQASIDDLIQVRARTGR